MLNVAEAATLAALPKAPDTYNPRKHPDKAVQRRNLVIDEMRDAGYLTAPEAESWKAYPLTLSSRSDYQGLAEYFVEYVRQLMQAKFGNDLYKEGYRIYTTLDLDAQQAAVNALEAQLEKIESNAVTGVGKFTHVSYRDYMDKRLGRRSGACRDAVPAGRGAGARGEDRQHPGHGRRPRLRRLEIQPDDAGDAAARLELQADRVQRGDPVGRVVRRDRARRAHLGADAVRPAAVGTEELRGPLQRLDADHPPGALGVEEQHCGAGGLSGSASTP